MRVLNLAIILLLIVAVGAVAGAWFDVVTVPVLSEMAYGMKGYGPAKTPEEAIEKFNKALEARNYKMASRYLDGEYQRKFRDNAKIATKLAEALDNFRATAKSNGISSEKVDLILLTVDPFPKKLIIGTGGVKTSEGNDTATTTVELEYSSALAKVPAQALNLKKIDGQWRMEVSLDEKIIYYHLVKKSGAIGNQEVIAQQASRREHLEGLNKHGQNLVNALNVVKNRLKTDATTKENVHADLRDELLKAVED